MNPAELEAVLYLRTPAAIRERCERVLERGLEGRLAHFRVHAGRLDAVGERVARVTRREYPDLEVPYHGRWRHFNSGGVDRLAKLEEQLAPLSPAERARARIDLVVTSVLLDAGAGEAWRYRESDGDRVQRRTLGRSEGLAVASFRWFLGGGFSSGAGRPLQVDADKLEALDTDHLARAFQVTETNPLAGLEGRATLLRRLGCALRRSPAFFGEDEPRPGRLLDYLSARSEGGAVPAEAILGVVLEGLGSIWPGRARIGSENLGDVWPHEAAGGTGPGAGLVPFHKLSQWLVYSLIEPFETAGLRVEGVERLTGLAEYRNGGLLVDTGVLEAKHDEVTSRAHAPGAETIVEWRALTVALLDRLAEGVRRSLGVERDALPLAKVLEGGTWRAGREVARERRSGGGPPIRIESDGTVF